MTTSNNTTAAETVTYAREAFFCPSIIYDLLIRPNVDASDLAPEDINDVLCALNAADAAGLLAPIFVDLGGTNTASRRL